MSWRVLLCVAGVCLAQSVPAATPPAVESKPAPARSAPAAAPGARPSVVRFVLQPPQEAQLASQMSGKLVRFLQPEGGAFRKGDRLAEFDCEERRAFLDKAKAARGKAEKTASSQKQLLELSAISQLEYEVALADAQEAQADVSMAQAQANQCVVVAPYAGRIVRRIANQHEHMTVGAPLMQIVETGTLKLELLVPSQWLRWLKTGTEFRIHIDEINADASARVSAVGARIDAASQTIDVRAAIVGNVPGLLPGMSGTANFGVR